MSLLGKTLLCIFVTFLWASSVPASPYVLITGGGGGESKAGSVGFEAGGTRAIKDTVPLIAGKFN